MSLHRRCVEWVVRTYGFASYDSLPNRAARFVEEAVEAGQAFDLPKELVLRIVERAYSRPKGDPKQELAGSQFTLNVLADRAGILLEGALAEELKRVEAASSDTFRRKQREKYEAGTELVKPL